MAVRSIVPFLICDFNTGATLASQRLPRYSIHQWGKNILWWIGRINNHRMFCRFVSHQIGIVIALSGPFESGLARLVCICIFFWLLTHRNRMDVHFSGLLWRFLGS